jgi:hypothetical protein
MRDSRTSTALRELSGLGREPDPAGWAWAVVTPERTGRLGLLIAAREALGAVGTPVRAVGICDGDALVLGRAGAGRPVTVDLRGRLYLPVAMRDDTALLVGAHRANEVVVIVAVTVLERLGDVLAAGFR